MLLGWNNKWNKLLQILAMIEEAVGTMMYETKKQQCQKTIEKKDNKKGKGNLGKQNSAHIAANESAEDADGEEEDNCL